MPDPSLSAQSLLDRLPEVRVVLVGTTHPGNMGSAARALKTMGLSQLAFVAPREFPAAEATALAAGADDLLAAAKVYDALEPALQDCVWVIGTSARMRGHSVPVMSPEAAAAHLLMHAGAGPVALVFGRESSGLSNDELDRCNATVQIPTAADFRSLNLAAAVQVMAYLLRATALGHLVGADAAVPRSESSAPDALSPVSEAEQNPDYTGIAPAHRPASHAELEALFVHLQRVLILIDFIDPERPRHIMRRLRHVFLRAGLTSSEVQILRGILTQTERGKGRSTWQE